MIILAVLAGTGFLVTGCVERRMSSSRLNVYDTTVEYGIFWNIYPKKLQHMDSLSLFLSYFPLSIFLSYPLSLPLSLFYFRVPSISIYSFISFLIFIPLLTDHAIIFLRMTFNIFSSHAEIGKSATISDFKEITSKEIMSNEHTFFCNFFLKRMLTWWAGTLKD